MIAMSASTRRDFVRLAAGASLIALVPLPVSATPQAVADEIAKLFPSKKPVEGKIKLDLPSIAENGLVVPLAFEVESPMTAADYVKTIHFFSEGNPQARLASFFFTPMIPKAAGAIRIRLAQTQNVVAVAEMTSGDVFITRREVKVTIGGCGG